MVAFTYHIYFIIITLTEKGPRGADVYISLNIAIKCSRNYAKNIHKGFILAF
jgi:hypothetical protein